MKSNDEKSSANAEAAEEDMSATEAEFLREVVQTRIDISTADTRTRGELDTHAYVDAWEEKILEYSAENPETPLEKSSERQARENGPVHTGTPGAIAEPRLERGSITTSSEPGAYASAPPAPPPTSTQINGDEEAPNESNNVTDDLVEAELVSDDVVIARAVNTTKTKLVGCLFVFLLVGLVIVAGTCGGGHCSATSSSGSTSPAETDDSSPVPSQTPSLSPSVSVSPSMAPTDWVVDNLPSYSIEAILKDASSPQANAYRWMLNDPYRTNYTNTRLLQRFALATIAYAFGGGLGNTWKNDEDWLSYDVDECQWHQERESHFYPEVPTNFSCSDTFEYLYLTPFKNDWNGTYPQEIAMLSKLQVLDMSENFIQPSPFPTVLFQLTNLRQLHLRGHLFSTGTFPTEIADLSKLEAFQLHTPLLTGTVPSELFGLTSLKTLILDRNDGLNMTIPTQIGLLSNLTNIATYGNPYLQGPIPSEIGILTSLDSLRLYKNQLSGRLPTQLGLLTELTLVLAQRNAFTGSIPSQFGLLSTNLEELSLWGNPLTGTIPTTLEQLTKLGELLISRSKLDGSVDNFSFPDSRWLTKIALDDTLLTGTFHPDLCRIKLYFDCSATLCGCDDCVCELETPVVTNATTNISVTENLPLFVSLNDTVVATTKTLHPRP